MTDYKKIGRDLIPWFWRKDVFKSYMEAGQEGLQTFHDTVFVPFKADVDEVLKYNGQHTVLEEFLNNTYDNTLRRIFITENDVVRAFGVDIGLNVDTFNFDPPDLGVNADTPQVPTVDFGINSDATTTFLYNFTIEVPAALTFTAAEEDKINREIGRWVEAHMRWDYNYF